METPLLLGLKGLSVCVLYCGRAKSSKAECCRVVCGADEHLGLFWATPHKVREQSERDRDTKSG